MGRVSCHEGEAESRAGRAQGCAGGWGTGGWRRRMGRVLTASSYLIDPCSVFEIFRCCRAKERSLGLGGTELGPTFSSDLSLPREKPQGQVLPVPISRPSQAGKEGCGCASANGERPWSPTPSTLAGLRTPGPGPSWVLLTSPGCSPALDSGDAHNLPSVARASHMWVLLPLV